MSLFHKQNAIDLLDSILNSHGRLRNATYVRGRMVISIFLVILINMSHSLLGPFAAA